MAAAALAAPLAAVAAALEDRLTEQWVLTAVAASEEDAAAARTERVEAIHHELARLCGRLRRLADAAAAP